MNFQKIPIRGLPFGMMNMRLAKILYELYKYSKHRIHICSCPLHYEYANHKHGVLKFQCSRWSSGRSPNNGGSSWDVPRSTDVKISPSIPPFPSSPSSSGTRSLKIHSGSSP